MALPATLAWAATSTTRPLPPIVIAVGTSPASTPIYVAEAEGYFADEGLNVRLDNCAYGRLCMAHLFNGRAQLATVAESPIAVAGLGGATPVIVAATTMLRRDAKIITRHTGNVRSASDLTGKRIGTFVGTTAHYFLHLTMLMTGDDPSDVTLISLKPEDNIAARLASGEIDAAVVFEPFGYQIARALGDDAKVITNSAFGYFWNLATTRKFAQANEAELERTLRAIDRAIQFIQRNPEQAKATVRQRLQTDESALDWIWPGMTFSLSLDRALLMNLQGQARWAVRFGYASGKVPDYAGFLYPGPLLRVRPELRENLR